MIPLAGLPGGRLAAGLGVQTVVMVGAGAAMWVYSGRELDTFVDLGWRPVVQGLVFGLALIAVIAAIFRLFPGFLEMTARLQARMAALFAREPTGAAFVGIAICAGIGEEAAFRGGLQTLAGDAIGPVAGIAISALAFALIHMARPLITAIILLIGVVFGLVFWWTGSLLTVMIGHAVYDVWALRVLHRELARLGYLDDPEDPETEPAV